LKEGKGKGGAKGGERVETSIWENSGCRFDLVNRAPLVVGVTERYRPCQPGKKKREGQESQPRRGGGINAVIWQTTLSRKGRKLEEEKSPVNGEKEESQDRTEPRLAWPRPRKEESNKWKESKNMEGGKSKKEGVKRRGKRVRSLDDVETLTPREERRPKRW